jgi:hypothetical protein
MVGRAIQASLSISPGRFVSHFDDRRLVAVPEAEEHQGDPHEVVQVPRGHEHLFPTG